MLPIPYVWLATRPRVVHDRVCRLRCCFRRFEIYGFAAPRDWLAALDRNTARKYSIAIRFIFAYNSCFHWTVAAENPRRASKVLNLMFHNQGSLLTLRCSGRIVLGKTDEIVCAAIRQHAKEVILELSEVSAIDAAGIGALLTLQAAGIYLKLVNPTAAVRSVLRLTNTDRVFEICESRTVPASPPATDHESALAGG
jgi:anti-anti-sigma factor